MMATSQRVVTSVPFSDGYGAGGAILRRSRMFRRRA